MKMLEHQKRVIHNLSGEKELFKKELYKSLDWLEKEEIEELSQWLRSNYWETNSEEIISVFRTIMIKNGAFFYYQKMEK
jgi:NTP pyrophosphatase (non-canonical NTP hydrolase)